ncbi:MAG TPA: P-II family nitrogen regulator [Lachnospiraceae bacterium]|nr:P-II family nitrogen regulator [Lachnospiraceae bacterium]HPF29436.1 P-II family nitrogen regulator [Lachnospiraceae bacterium]
MKKLEIVTRPEKLHELRMILEEFGVTGLNIFHMEGYGNQKGHYEGYDSEKNEIQLLPMIKVETVVDAAIAGTLIEKISKGIRTGNYGDGKIFVFDVEDAIRIRTGDRGKGAL